MKHILSSKLVIALVAMATVGRLGYLGWEKHVTPRIEAFMSPTAAVDNQPPLSAAGYDMLSALRKIDDWELDVEGKNLKHKASGKLSIHLSQDEKGNFFYSSIKMPWIYLEGNRIDNFYTPEDLKAIDKASMTLANTVRERTVAATRDKLQKALGVSSTDVQVKAALKPEAKPGEVPAVTFPSANRDSEDTKRDEANAVSANVNKSAAVVNNGPARPWYESNLTLMGFSVVSMLGTSVLMVWLGRRQTGSA